MKAFEVMATLNDQKHLLLDDSLEIETPSGVKVILLISDDQDNEPDPDDTPKEEIKASLKRALLEFKEGKRIPLEEMWEGIDAE
jgi:hypothetical protein